MFDTFFDLMLVVNIPLLYCLYRMANDMTTADGRPASRLLLPLAVLQPTRYFGKSGYFYWKIFVATFVIFYVVGTLLLYVD